MITTGGSVRIVISMLSSAVTPSVSVTLSVIRWVPEASPVTVNCMKPAVSGGSSLSGTSGLMLSSQMALSSSGASWSSCTEPAKVTVSLSIWASGDGSVIVACGGVL